MDRKETVAVVSALLSTLADMDYAPRSSFYLLMGMNYDAYINLERGLVDTGLVTTTSDTIRLTPKGKQLGDSINAALANRQAATDAPFPDGWPYREVK